jgi:hypothetical protein
MRNAMEKVAKKIRATNASFRRFIFTFHLEDGVAFGGQFECDARSRDHAFALLRQRLPGAIEHIKNVAIAN